MNIFLHELRANRKTTIIWTCSIAALIILFMSLFPGIERDADTFKKMLESYPESIRNAFGSSIDNITSLSGFYSFILFFVTLGGAIQAMNLGLSILSKESRERTADFLLTKPVSRTKIMTSKLLAAVTLLLATNAACYAAGVITASAAKVRGYDSQVFFLLTATIFLIQLMFFALGVIISVLFQKLKSVVPISMGTVFALFFIGTLLVKDENDAVRFLSPFKYFDAGYIINNSCYEAKYFITEVILVAVFVAASYVVYSKKDIHAVN